MIYCGIDWAERAHDVALVDDTGVLVAKRHITDDAAGYKVLMELLAEHGDTEENPISVAIETSRGLLVAMLRTGKRRDGVLARVVVVVKQHQHHALAVGDHRERTTT